jgi:outer membrane protein assembly factor BamB
MVAKVIPIMASLLAAAILVAWHRSTPAPELARRVPGRDRAADSQAAAPTDPFAALALTQGPGQPGSTAGAWPGFRGPDLNLVAPPGPRLARQWPADGPPRRWTATLGEGYAGAAVRDGRVFILDYDRPGQADALRCLSLADGREIWRLAYPVAIKRNHGMSRTIPAVTSDRVVSFGPLCHVVCADAATGRFRWGLDLVRDYGVTVPPWYAGQCPLIVDDAVVLGVGGRCLAMKVELATGKVLWETPNPRAWKMTHASLTPIVTGGVPAYLYAASGGLAAIAADDGRLLWDSPVWKISIATVASPVVVDAERVFLAGGYNAGALLLRLPAGEEREPEPLFRLTAQQFGAAQQTPIAWGGHLYGIRPDGELACLTLSGTLAWTSGPQHRFGLGPCLIADDLLLALNDDGLLTLAEATPAAFRPLAQAQVLTGAESWAPMALAGGLLLVRDFTQMVCLDLTEK